MRSWIWGGALTVLTAVGVSWSVAPPRPTECVLEVATPRPCAVAVIEVVAVTDAMDVFDELRGPPSSDEPPLAPPRPDAPGDVIPAVFLLPADVAEGAEEAPAPRLARELAPMPRLHENPTFSVVIRLSSDGK